MTTPIKRTRSGRSYQSPATLNSVERNQQSDGPSRKIRCSPIKKSGPSRANDVEPIWHHDTHVTDLEGDTINPYAIPAALRSTLASSITSFSFLLRTGTSEDASFAPRLPFAGSAHVLGQAIKHRFSAQQHHMQTTKFRYRTSLWGHTSCVNALAISRGQGQWLASAGDDKEIHIRDLFVGLRNDHEVVPRLILKGHESNIFSLDWSAQNQYLYSTGNDSQILYYDVEHSQLPIRGTAPSAPEYRSPLNPSAIGAHDDSVPELSAHPTNPNLVLSCDDGGNLKLIDIRISHDSVAAARSDVVAGFSSVQWNPNVSDGNTFAAATCGRITGSTRLYDVRQCFSSDQDRHLSSKDAVLSYHTALMQHSSKRGLIAAAAETNSICFDPDGRFLASSISRYHPTIYSVNDPDPLATLESTVAEDPVPDGYCEWSGVPLGTPAAPKRLFSCCTIKHGSFGLQTQTGKLHYAIGSDDFRTYVFEIPDKDELLRRREYVNRRHWIDDTSKLHVQRRQAKAAEQEAAENDEEEEAHNGDAESDLNSDMDAESRVDHESEVAYCAGSILRADNIVRPARIQKQDYVLCGGRSILNTALIHPTLPIIFTAGIVPEVNVHSANPLHPKDIHRDPYDWGEERDNKIGGTRCRFLLPPSSNSLLDVESDEPGSHSSDEDDSEGDSDDESGSEDGDDDDDDDSDERFSESGAERGRVPNVNTREQNPSLVGVTIHMGRIIDHIYSGQDAVQEPDDLEAEDDDADTGSSESDQTSSSGFKCPYRRTSSNERNLYGSPSISSRDSEEQERGRVQSMDESADHRDADAQSRLDAIEVAALLVDRNANPGEAEVNDRQDQPQGTVQDFLSAMRSDPMYNTTTAALDYHQDRHIGTYSLSHLSPNLLPADSPPSSDSDLDAGVDADTPRTSHGSKHSDEDLDGTGSDAGSRPWDEDDDPYGEGYEYDPWKHDGYGSTVELTSEIDERDRDEMRTAFQGSDDEFGYSANGQMWSTLRSMEHTAQNQRQMRIFDQLLRRDELKSLTAGFKKVPHYAGGEGEGSDFTCRSCEGRIDTDE